MHPKLPKELSGADGSIHAIGAAMTSSPELSYRLEVLLSIQRALWDMVTPALRGVAIQFQGHQVRGRFLYAQEPSAEEREIVAEVEAYMVADFAEPVDVLFDAQHHPAEAARHLRLGEEWVYLRREA